MHAAAVENLEPFLKIGAKVLDIGKKLRITVVCGLWRTVNGEMYTDNQQFIEGCGSGYLLSIFHFLVSPIASKTTSQNGQVVGIDHLAPLVQLSRENISKSPTTRAVLDRDIKVMLGDGREGCAAGEIPAEGWDVIHASVKFLLLFEVHHWYCFCNRLEQQHPLYQKRYWDSWETLVGCSFLSERMIRLFGR